MSFIIPIRKLLALRHTHSDQLLIDYLDVVIHAKEPGRLSTAELQERWRVTQPNVSRRIARLAAAELIDCTTGWSGYHIHEVSLLGVSE